MQKNLPLVAIVGADPAAAVTIQVIIGDICRIEHCCDHATVLDADESGDLPDVILAIIDVPNIVRRGIEPRFRGSVAGPPLVHVSAADVCIGDDGAALPDCLVTPSRPTEFRATVEARLRRSGGCASRLGRSLQWLH